ncbi:MAG TPA: hypothetical protein VLS93_04800 [Anaeromyxobacteraceae bacterium]|nr:hypothetical protein [Anaeromyxobacteraceae bacterium]
MRPIERTARHLLPAGLALLLLAAPAPAAASVPVRVRVLEGSKTGPARLDPRLADLKRQLSPLAYVRWEERSERHLTMTVGKTEWIPLPGGDQVGLTLLEVRPDSVTFEVAISAQNTQSRLSVERGQRIVHQVTREKGGAAVFVSVNAWP